MKKKKENEKDNKKEDCFVYDESRLTGEKMHLRMHPLVILISIQNGN